MLVLTGQLNIFFLRDIFNPFPLVTNMFSFLKGKKKGADAPRIQLPSELDQRAFSGRAYARHSQAVLVLVNMLLVGIIMFLIFNQYLITDTLNKKNFAVFRENCAGGIETANISEFQTAPDSITVRSLSWNLVRNIKSAGSGNADVVYDEARRLMTADMKQAFQVISDEERRLLKQAAANGGGVYRVIDKLTVKMLDKDDLPPGTKTEIGQYDTVVNGTARVLDMATNQPVGLPDNFSIRIHAVPLVGRTEANPWGLLVSSIDFLDPNKSVRRLKEIQQEKEKGNSSGSTIGDALGISPDKMQEDRESIKKNSGNK